MIGNEEAELLNEVDDGLIDIAEAFIESMVEVVEKNTKKQVKFLPSSALIVNNIKLDTKIMKVFDLGYSLNNIKLEIYLMLESKSK